MADVADAVDLANAVDAADADAAGMLDAVGVCGLGHVGRTQTQTRWTQRTWWAMDAVDLVDRGHGGAAQGSLGIWERSIGSF